MTKTEPLSTSKPKVILPNKELVGVEKEKKKEIEMIELEIDRYFEKRKFNELENLSVKLSYLEKINKNLN